MPTPALRAEAETLSNQGESDLQALEAKRHACEVQYVLALPSRERRAAYLAVVREHRGPQRAESIAEAVRALWGTRRDQGRAQLERLIEQTNPALRVEDGDEALARRDEDSPALRAEGRD